MTVPTFRSRLAGVALMVALTTSACALRGSGFQYVRHRPTGTYYKIPSSWQVFHHNDVISFIRTRGEGAVDPEERLPFATTFDAANKPEIDRFYSLDTRSERPSGTARVQVLTEEEHDTISLSDLRSVFIDVDEGAAAGQVDILRYEEIEPPGGFRGQRMVFNVTGDGGIFTINQTALLDRSTRHLYLFAIGCSAQCYEKNRRLIDEVASSWTVKEK
jgi:hypothetical protein